MTTKKLVAAIMSGGASSRMGFDKAQLKRGCRTLLEHTVAACMSAELEVTVVGRERPAGWAISGCNFLSDEIPGLGPMGGLISVLKHFRDERAGVLAVACDMPMLDSDTIRWLIEASKRDGPALDGAVSVTSDGRLQPLFSVYAADSLAGLRRCLSVGKLSLTGAIERGRFHRVAVPANIEPKLANINCLEEAKRFGLECSINTE